MDIIDFLRPATEVTEVIVPAGGGQGELRVSKLQNQPQFQSPTTATPDLLFTIPQFASDTSLVSYPNPIIFVAFDPEHSAMHSVSLPLLQLVKRAYDYF